MRHRHLIHFAAFLVAVSEGFGTIDNVSPAFLSGRERREDDDDGAETVLITHSQRPPPPPPYMTRVINPTRLRNRLPRYW